MGLLGMISGPVAYIVFKRIYGGLYKNDPEKYPINEEDKAWQSEIPREYHFLSGFWQCL